MFDQVFPLDWMCGPEAKNYIMLPTLQTRIREVEVAETTMMLPKRYLF